MSDRDVLAALYQSIRHDPAEFGPGTARLEVHGNRVIGAHRIAGLNVDVDERDDGIAAVIRVDEGVRIEPPVHMCFGMLPEEGLQKIDLDMKIGADASVNILAHCTFPNAVNVQHLMEADIEVGPGAEYAYFERHVHGPEGGVNVVPHARVAVREGGSFKTEFELIRGRVGKMDIDYEAECEAHAVLDMLARISGRGDDCVRINEVGHLRGAHASGALTSHVALRENARARIENTLTAHAPGARGHVDCKEIVQDHAVASAVPVVEVHHPGAHITHEAAIGSVDSRQLETLLARGLTEDQATELIIEGLLSR
ncbi:SufD family Fe-S cluster assembly protein [Kiritimatiella glycovorans]|uniref:Cysteine desulfurase activator complex subunit SufB n=1 Tax=Kiritimatiella glycovorans TaxID=1307763 RepID=A0A0G3EHD9_9BACT|nr:SufD family Fe-S cluster assembly protein [Kiritimatiella glycovorans]AKJ63589.1 cysteine desulfurase activator complex subunit SufB [Kiritimatiella glycovorans]